MTEGKAVLARNTAWSAAAHVVNLAIPVLMMPYIVSRVSLPEYGLWIVLTSLAAWLSHYDLGLWGALSREVADRRARGDHQGLRVLYHTWLRYDLLAGTAVVGAIALFARPVVQAVAPGLPWTPLFIPLAIQAVLVPPLRHLSYSLTGLQRSDLTHRVSLVIAPLSAAALIAALEMGAGLRGMALNGVAFAAIQAACYWVLLRREGYPVGLGSRLFSWAELRKLVGVGWKMQGTLFVGQAFRSDRILMKVTGFAPAMISVYQFGAGLMDRLAASVGVLSSAVLPAASDLAARGDSERLRTLLMRSTKYHGLAAAGLLGFAALFGPELMVLWMGRPLPEAVTVLRIMTLGGIFTAIGSPAQAVGVARGRPGWPLVSSLAGLAATVILYITLGRRYDYGGLAGSVSIGLALVQVVFMTGMRRTLEFRWGEFVGNALLKPAVLVLPLGIVYAGWRMAAPHWGPVATRSHAFAVLVPAFLVALGLGWILARAFRVVDDYDVSVLKSLGRRPPA